MPLAPVFRFFEQPGNLALITPPWLCFVIRSPGAIDMRRGLTIDYTIRWLGLPMGWTSRIVTYHPPGSLVDEQVRGPYRLWRHHHDFEETPSGTIIRDRVEYALPLGPLGETAHWAFVRRQLLDIFNFRQRAVAKRLGVECATLAPPSIRRRDR